MKCPVCKTPDLLMADRQGIEVDYCPTCRGVWLDRGELDKLIERSADEPVPQGQAQAAAASMPVARRHDEGRHYNDHDRRHGHDDHEYRDRRYPYKKKKSLLGDLFDFG